VDVQSSSAATWQFGSASSMSRTPRASCASARSTPRRRLWATESSSRP
jgi:hypothetical protein